MGPPRERGGRKELCLKKMRLEREMSYRKAPHGQKPVENKKRPELGRDAFQIQIDSQTTGLRLGWSGGRRGRLGGRLLCGSGATLHRVGRVVKAHDVLRDVNLRGSIKNRSVLGGGVQDYNVAVLAGVFIEHVHHLAADAVDDFTLRRVHVLLKLVIEAIEALRGLLALLGQACNFVLAALAFAGGETLAQIVNLFVQVFQLALTRSELGLEFGGSLFAFGGISDGATNVDDANLTRCG